MDSRIEMIERKPIIVADPAAGANYSVSNTGLGPWRILSLAFQLVTSAVVANRALSLEVDDGTDTFLRLPAGAVQAASLTVRYGAADGLTGATAVGSVTTVALPNGGAFLEQGWRLRTVIDNLDASDQLSKLRLFVEEYPSGRYFSANAVNQFLVEAINAA